MNNDNLTSDKLTLDELTSRIKEHIRYHYLRVISWAIAILTSVPLLILNAYVRNLFGFFISAAVIVIGVSLVRSSHQTIIGLNELKKWTNEKLKEFPGSTEVDITLIGK